MNVELTADQLEIARAPIEARQLVLAGAGTGKTFTLIERLRYLVQEKGLSPGSEILVLSFSRAAVREIKNRVREQGGDIAFVRARTFDSFATRLLQQIEDGGTWMNLGYDPRIAYAAKQDLEEELSEYEHVIVDEVQDLVSVRAELVKRILEQANCGFSLFGDIAQSIYNFQLRDDPSGMDFPRLLHWLKERFAMDLETMTLERNHRAASPITRAVWDIWPQFGESEPDFAKIRTDLMEIVHSGDRIDDYRLLRRYAADTTARTAVLSRTNGTALLISRQLHELGYPHALQRDATDQLIHPWVAAALGSFNPGAIAYPTFEAMYLQIEEVGMPDVEESWLALRSVAKMAKQIDLGRLVAQLRLGAVPELLNVINQAPLLVSTVHKSKGREFERVVIVDDLDDEFPDGDAAEETRVLFVAATRPRRDIFTISRPKIGGYLKTLDSGRWVHNGRKWWMRWGIELRVHDLDRLDPPGATIRGADPRHIQEYIRTRIVPGDSLEMRLTSDSLPADGPPDYSVHHEDEVVGVTGEAFGMDLLKWIGRGAPRWPVAIRGLYVEGIETVAGTPAASQNASVGPAGLWLGVRPIGLGALEWSE